MTPIADMTLDDLKKLVEETLDERLTHLLGAFELPDDADEAELPPWDEIRAAVEQRRWTPPPGAKSSLELLREVPV